MQLKEKIQTREVFDKKASNWSQGYLGHNFSSHNFQVRKEKVLSLLNISAGCYLDIGCGSGDFLKDLANGGGEVFGIDGAHRMIVQAKQLYKNIKNIHLLKGDIEQIPFPDNYFDCIICVGVLEYLPKDSSPLKELRRVLKKNGELVITVPSKLSPFIMLDRLLSFCLKSAAKLLDQAGIYELIMKRKRSKGVYSFHKWYVPGQFDRLAKSLKFKIVEKRRCSFGSMIIGNYIPLSVPFSRFMESINQNPLDFLALNYIIKLKK